MSVPVFKQFFIDEDNYRDVGVKEVFKSDIMGEDDMSMELKGKIESLQNKLERLRGYL